MRYLFAVLLTAVLGSACISAPTVQIKMPEDEQRAFDTTVQDTWVQFDWNRMDIQLREIKRERSQLSGHPIALGAFPNPPSTDTRLLLRKLAITDTVAIVMRRRQARFEAVQTMKRNQLVGETLDGYLQVRLSILTQEQDIVVAENHDRRLLFLEVIRQHGAGMEYLNHVQQEFSAVQRQMAPSGAFVQRANGQWEVTP